MQERSHVSPVKKAVLVTGCDTGFGYFAALELAKKGYLVFAGCLTLDSVKNFEEMNSSIIPLQLDVRNIEHFSNAFSVISKKCPEGIWAIVNNAGIMCHSFIDFTSVEDFRKMMEINFLGAVICIKTFLPLLKKQKNGSARIINMTSASEFFPYTQLSGYIATKAALDAFTRIANIELSLHGIKCIQISPGGHSTTMLNTLNSNLPPDELIIEKYGKQFLDELKKDKKNLSNMIKYFPGPINVANSIVQAVSSQNPWNRYVVGLDAYLVTYPLSCLPSFISNFLGTILLKFSYSPLPHTLTGIDI